jgi:mono/diheme cytochrome c family protein
MTASKEDLASADRGGKLFVARCGGCHGNSAKGTDAGPSLIYSIAVIRDEKGELIGPILREGRPDRGMPRLELTEAQIFDIATWLRVQVYAADHRVTYDWLDVLTGDARKGEAYFKGDGMCTNCHSATGDLAGIGKKYDPFALQTRWVNPTPVRAPGAVPDAFRAATRVTISLATGQTFTGVLERISDFNVSLRDEKGEYRSFTREGDDPKVQIDDPLKRHKDMLRQYTDADIHNVTAYLATLK